MAGTQEDLKQLVRTRHAIVTIATVEEDFAIRTIREVGRELGRGVMEWTISDGLRPTMPSEAPAIDDSQKLPTALRYMRDSLEPYIYVLKDSMRHLSDPTAERLMRDTATDFALDTRTIFMVDPDGAVPASLAPLAVPYDLALPDDAEIEQIVRHTIRALLHNYELHIEMTAGQWRKFLTNLRGLTRMEVSQVAAEAVLSDNKLSADDIDLAIEAKRRRLRSSCVLDYIPPPEEIPEVGGMANLQKWLAFREGAWTPQAKAFGLEPPKGILMLGVQGCGKSLMARYVAAHWQLPLLRMDVGALYDKYVGETERRLRRAFQTAGAMAPCVLWIDEIEKAFASAGAGADGARSDGGLSQRMFGMLLTWMQDRPSAVFLVASANDITAMPPELMRKGRFDEIFFVDLPRAEARSEIFRIHLAKRKRRPEDFDLPVLAAAAEGFSGSEIEQAIVSAMYAAFAAKRNLATQDLLEELKATRPISVVMAEKIQTLRAWAADRCVLAD